MDSMSASAKTLFTAAGTDPSLAVRLRNISKIYQLEKAGYWSLFSRRKQPQSDSEASFTALAGVDVDIPKGTGIGVLGLNGAGKSTLLKIIASQLVPTTGTVEVNGRVQFLELGAGFSNDQSARQNVISAARAEGLSRSEIDARLAYVQQFADIGPHFDQPMRTYSSGMRSRVAFANAFAERPDILIVDEALAVGDAVFANKCARKIAEVRAAGTTLIFTSHSTDAVLKMCQRGVVLHRGRIVAAGDAKEAVAAYRRVLNEAAAEDIDGTDQTAGMAEITLSSEPTQTGDRAGLNASLAAFDGKDHVSDCTLYNDQESIRGSGGARILGCAALVEGLPARPDRLRRGDRLEIIMRVHFERAAPEAQIGFTITDTNGVAFFGTNQLWLGQSCKAATAGEVRDYRISVPLMLAGGDWFIELGVADGMRELQVRESALHFHLQETNQHIGPGWLDARLTFMDDAARPQAQISE
jgi:lipopolysaccharide transport system ATP-binding protein